MIVRRKCWLGFVKHEVFRLKVFGLSSMISVSLPVLLSIAVMTS